MAAVLNLLVVNSLGVEQPFYSGCLRPSENTDSDRMIHNCSKISYKVATNNFTFGCHYNMRKCIKGLKHYEVLYDMLT